MSLMDTLNHLIDRRAEQLAYLLLTQKGNLTVSNSQAEDQGLDFLVQIPARFSKPSPQFGVQVKGRKTSPSSNGHAAHSALEVPGVKQGGPYQRLSLPVCLFLFFMDTDAGYFSWLQEPVLQRHGGLRPNDAPLFQPLNQVALDQLVATVRDWEALKLKAA